MYFPSKFILYPRCGEIKRNNFNRLRIITVKSILLLIVSIALAPGHQQPQCWWIPGRAYRNFQSFSAQPLKEYIKTLHDPSERQIYSFIGFSAQLDSHEEHAPMIFRLHDSEGHQVSMRATPRLTSLSKVPDNHLLSYRELHHTYIRDILQFAFMFFPTINNRCNDSV